MTQLRFLAAAGPTEAIGRLSDALCERNAASLEPVLRLPRLAAWVVPGTPHVLARDGMAVAVGLLFDRTSGRRQDLLPDPLPPPDA